MNFTDLKLETVHYLKTFAIAVLSNMVSLVFFRTNYKHRNQIIVIYSMRKVGSTSIYHSLYKMIPGKITYHLHYLSSGALEKLGKIDSHNNNIKKANQVLKVVRKNPSKRLKIISIVRDPIAVEISYIFHTLRWAKGSIENISYEGLVSKLEERNFQYAINWFDDEFVKYLNLDVYEYPFDKEKGYALISKGNVDVLLIKLEKYADCSDEAFKSFLGLDEMKLNHANKTTNWGYKDLYNEVKKNYRVSEEKMDEIYDSKFVNHFYSDDEVAAFKKKWKK